MALSTIALWSLILCLIGGAAGLLIVRQLRRVQRLLRRDVPLSAGPVELWGTLRVRDSRSADPTDAALIYQHVNVYQSKDTELERFRGNCERCLVVDCELETSAGKLPIDLQHCRVQSFRYTQRTPNQAEVSGGTGLWNPSLPMSEPPDAHLSYELSEHRISDGTKVLLLGDAVTLDDTNFKLRGSPVSPLLICQGDREHWLGMHVSWLIVLVVLCGFCLYQGATMFHALSLHRSLLFS